MTRPSATGERLARMEAILERLETKLDIVEGKVDRDVADLAAVKNKGVGLLVGVGLLATGMGAAATKLWQAFTGS